MKIKVSWIMSIFTLIVKLLEQNARASDKESVQIEESVASLRRKQSAVDAEGNRARRNAAKLKEIFE